MGRGKEGACRQALFERRSPSKIFLRFPVPDLVALQALFLYDRDPSLSNRGQGNCITGGGYLVAMAIASSTTVNSRPCDTCAIVIPDTWPYCPHCGMPSRFPNRLAADRADEKSALDSDYNRCRDDAIRNGTIGQLDAFGELCRRSKAVFMCTFSKLLPIITNHTQLYADFYSLASLRCNPQTSEKNWEVLRLKAEADLIEGNPTELKIHYASLTVDESGLESYGECTVVLRDDMIGHRSTVFPENSALYFEKNPGKPRAGMRALWEDRHKTCVVKFASLVNAKTQNTDFASILVQGSVDGLTDQMVEVHVVGPVTIRTFDKVRIPKPATMRTRVAATLGAGVTLPRPDKMYFEACRKQCEVNRIQFEGI